MIKKSSLILAFFIVNTLFSQTNAPSIQTGVTFQWSDTQTVGTDPATIQSITINGIVYLNFGLPTGYELTQLGPTGHPSNDILLNGANTETTSASATWDASALASFQDLNLNHYFVSNGNGRNICNNYTAEASTDAQRQTLTYSNGILASSNGVIAITERNANNCYHVELFGIPVGGGAEQSLGETFVNQTSTQYGFGGTGANSSDIGTPGAMNPPNSGTDYWLSDRVVENNGTIGIALFYLDDIAPNGSIITKAQLTASSNDHADGKLFIFTLPDLDGDGFSDLDDLDDDNDGLIDTSESGGINPSADDDVDGIPNYQDPNFCTLNAFGICENLDSDQDGVPNHLDIDRDNDGIPDVVELGFSDTDKDGTLLGTGWLDTNMNGVHDSYETPPASYLDTDSDNIPDYLDLDSDNDGIFDTVEYDGKGDVDIDGDGIGDGDDSEDFNNIINDNDNDGDGILAIIDTNDDDADSNDFGTSYADPIDDDNDGIPNYRDVDSDDAPNDFSNGSDIDKTQIYAYLDADNDGILDDTVDTDNDGILDIFDTDNTVFGSPRDLDDNYTLFFDGRNDYVEDTNVIASGDATLMVWIKTDGANNLADNQVIAGQDNFYLMYDGSVINVVLNGATVATSTTSPTDNIWIHAAATTTAGETMLYVNGIQEATSTSGAITTDTSNFTVGRLADTDANYFKGSIDEVRVFGYTLTEEEVKRMVYQELSVAETGEIIPLNISTTLPGTLSRYYKMDTYTGDITSNLSSGGKLYNIKDVYFQTAPLPYETVADGDWTDTATWLHGDVWDITTKQNNESDASIVHIKNDISLDGAYDIQGMVGLIVDNGSEFTIEADKGLYNSWYLKLDGLIDLEGESQLVQTEGSILDPTSAGALERDQQGHSNTYIYNYWCSPVGITNSSTNNNSYTVPDVISNVAFTSIGHNGIASPVTNADYWIWKYTNSESDNYSKWQHVRSTNSLLVGEGFTMKGPGTVTAEQNYVFLGKPNNEDLTSPIALNITAGNDYLIGNPFPSALDADEFILDNIGTTDGGRNVSGNIINGALYFWDHFANNTHVLAEYEGGYATYTLMGELPAISNDARINASGASGTKLPKQYIPVGQGFFVSTILDASLVGASNDPGITQPIVGGDIVIKNSQRIFKTEAADPSLFLKSNNKKSNSSSNIINEDSREKIRLMFNSPDGYHRQLLLGADSRASNNYDLGFEAPLNGASNEDMYWLLNDIPLVIQAIHDFNETHVLPLGIKTKNGGIIEINIEALENIPNDTQIYLKDKNTNSFHDLRAASFTTTVLSGEINDRFELTFNNSSNSLTTDNIALENELLVFFNQSIKSISILNPKNRQINKLEIVNTLGQIIIDKEINSANNNILVPINTQDGVYIFKMISDDFIVSKKIIIGN